MQVQWLEWFGSITGIVGATMMAANTRTSPWAYPVWVIASLAMLAFALSQQHYGLAVQQGFFSAINLLGLYRWMLRPPVAVSDVAPTTRNWARS